MYLYDFEMLNILFERYGFDEVEQKKICESSLEEFKEPLHVEGMDSVWVDLNQEFFQKHNLIHHYNEKEKKYETNFAITGFDRDPISSLIVEAKKTRDVNQVNILDKRNYHYSQSFLDDENFRLKYKKIKSISAAIDEDKQA